jgi:hypothetical protein
LRGSRGGREVGRLRLKSNHARQVNKCQIADSKESDYEDP